MCNTLSLSFSNIRKITLIGGFLVAAIAVLMPVSGYGQCANWNAQGRVTIDQRGSTFPVYLDLVQKGKVLTGKAQYTVNRGNIHLNGTVDGTISGSVFNIQIFWEGSLTGVYNAKVLPSGRLDGDTYDKNNSTVRQPWNSREVLKCAPVANPFFGTLPATKTPAPRKPPYVTASQGIFPVPGGPGFIVVTWDAGPNNPNAELVYRINTSDDLPLMKAPKGGHQLTVVHGQTYTFYLKDGGKTLALQGMRVP